MTHPSIIYIPQKQENRTRTHDFFLFLLKDSLKINIHRILGDHCKYSFLDRFRSIEHNNECNSFKGCFQDFFSVEIFEENHFINGKNQIKQFSKNLF